MKFYIRRAVVGAVATPIVAGAYFAVNALLIGAGATPSNSPDGVWTLGLTLGVIVAIGFTFAPQVMSLDTWLEKKAFGEEN